MVNEVTVGYARNSYGFRPADRQVLPTTPRDWYRSALGVDPPRLEPFGPYRRPARARLRPGGRIPVRADHELQRRQPRRSARQLQPRRVGAGGWTLPAANRNLRWTFQDDLSWTRGRHNFKFGVSTEWASKTEPQSVNYMGNYDFGHNAAESAQHGQRLRERAHRRLHHLHGVDQPGRPRPPALADRRVPAGQLAHEAAASRSTTACG